MKSSDAVIHLIDDDEAVRQALSFLLASAGHAVRIYPSGDTFLEQLPSLQPGCLITDVRMPGTDGLAVQRRLTELNINLPVIVMTGHADVPLAVEAMKAGAVDFIEKPFDDEKLLAAIKLALSRFCDEGQNDNEVTKVQTKLQSLSQRETQVLHGLLQGLPNKTIAYDLNLSPRTVEVHRANLMSKMGASSLSDLIRMALLSKSFPN